jgi:hypothetical protein
MPTFQLKLPVEQISLIERSAASRGLSKSEFARQLIDAGLTGTPAPPDLTIVSNAALLSELARRLQRIADVANPG